MIPFVHAQIEYFKIIPNFRLENLPWLSKWVICTCKEAGYLGNWLTEKLVTRTKVSDRREGSLWWRKLTTFLFLLLWWYEAETCSITSLDKWSWMVVSFSFLLISSKINLLFVKYSSVSWLNWWHHQSSIVGEYPWCKSQPHSSSKSCDTELYTFISFPYLLFPQATWVVLKVIKLRTSLKVCGKLEKNNLLLLA